MILWQKLNLLKDFFFLASPEEKSICSIIFTAGRRFFSNNINAIQLIHGLSNGNAIQSIDKNLSFQISKCPEAADCK
ncbi:MAG: hypothetical protein HUK40_07105 [Desulfobacter sp.]|nr:hypothetical protein [Desulfobacter sp.]WDP84158.1 MAG: hypothetical protein HUN05_02450 [Desulfobacter sp.]